MRLLQRYILGELLRIFAFVLSVVTVLLVFVGVFREVSESGLGPYEALQILPFVVPSLLPYTIPAVLLLTVTVVYGRISADQEITAAKSAGINVLSLLWPSFMLGAVLSVGSLLLSDQVIPWSVAHIQRIGTLAMEDLFLERLRTQNGMTDREHGITITVMGVRNGTLIRPTFRYAPHGRTPITIQAQEARLTFDLDRQQVVLHLLYGHIDAPGHQNLWFVREDRPFPLPTKTRRPKPRHLSIREIESTLEGIVEEHDGIEQQRDIETAFALALGDFGRFHESEFTDYNRALIYSEVQFKKLRTELHGRFALSCSCFFFVLLGSPFSILQARRHFLTSFALVFLPILLIYYPIVFLMLNQSKAGTVDPSWAMWVGNVVLLVVSWFVLRKALRH